MLNRTPANLSEPEVHNLGRASPESTLLADGLALFRRQWPLIVGIAVAAVCLGVAYLLVTPARYQASANVLLDTRKLQLTVYQGQSALGETAVDFGAVDSHIELLKSETIARAVVEELKLDEDAEATGQNVTSFFGSLTGALWNLFDRDPSLQVEQVPVASREQMTQAAIRFVRVNLKVQRVRFTYVVEIGFQALSPGKAASVANAVAEAYIQDQTLSKQAVTKRATTWLQQRMAELREQAIAADRAVQDYKTKNNIVTTGRGTADEQQLAELTSQAIITRSQTIEAKAKLDQLQDVIKTGTPDAILSQSPNNEVISKLRQQYVDASRRLSDYSVRFGRDHAAVENLRRDMQRIRTAAVEELRRVAESHRGDYEVAKSREQSVQDRVRTLTEQDAETRQGQGALQALESAAKAYRGLHENFLQRYVEATQQQSIATTEARVLSPAERGIKISPNTRHVMTLAAMLGIMAGVGAAFGRERLDAVFRTPRQLERALGVQCVGIIPALPPRPKPKKISRSVDDSPDRVIEEDLGIARQVILTPFSRFSETIRSIKVAADTHSTSHDIRVIGFASAVPAEGKSTMAANLAQLTAHSGSLTLLIDGDLRNPSLSRLMAPNAKGGVLEVLDGSEKLGNTLWRDPITGLHFLPAALNQPIAHTSEVLASKSMSNLIKVVREQYDYVVIDFPPLAPVVDAKAGSHIVDGFVLVVEWGRTSTEVIAEALGSAEVVQSKLIAAVLNRANPAALKRLEAYKGANYHQYYTSYVSGG